MIMLKELNAFLVASLLSSSKFSYAATMQRVAVQHPSLLLSTVEDWFSRITFKLGAKPDDYYSLGMKQGLQVIEMNKSIVLCNAVEWAKVIKSIGYCKGERGSDLRKEVYEHCKKMLDAKDIKLPVLGKVYRAFLVTFCTGKSGGLRWDTLTTKVQMFNCLIEHMLSLNDVKKLNSVIKELFPDPFKTLELRLREIYFTTLKNRLSQRFAQIMLEKCWPNCPESLESTILTHLI